MVKDVEALFRKINQADLPYRVFESNNDLEDEPEVARVAEALGDDAIAQTPATPAAPSPQPDPPAQPSLVVRVPASASPPVAPLAPPAPATRSLFRNYAPPTSGGPRRLSEIFARMKPRPPGP